MSRSSTRRRHASRRPTSRRPASARHRSFDASDAFDPFDRSAARPGPSGRLARRVAVVAVSCAWLALLAPLAAGAATDAVSFSTSGQSLWGPVAGQKTSSFVADVLDQTWQDAAGEIRTVDVTVDNSTAQAIWEQAIDTCDKKSYCFPIVGCFSPTRNQCRDGFCYPTGLTSRQCVAGIGPKPSGTIDKPFDVGAEISWDAHFRAGVRGSLVVDHGSVAVDASASVTLTPSTASARPGDLVTLHTAAATGPVDLRTTWPGVDGSVELYVDSGALVLARAAGPDTTTGQQRDQTVTVLDSGTIGVQSLEMAGFHVGADGLQLRWLGQPFLNVTDGHEENIAVPVVEVPGAIAISLPILDLGLYTPEMATPVPDPATYLGNAVNGVFDGVSIMNSIDPANRLGFQYGVIDAGIQDTDVGRFDADADVVSAYVGAPMGMAADIVPIGPFSLLSVEGNAFDLDIAFFFGFRKKVTFEPNLEIELHFSPAVEVEVSPGVFQSRSMVRVPAGADVVVKQPASNLDVQPVYSLSANRFVNDTDFIMEPTIKEQVMSLTLGGLIYDYGGAPAGLPGSFAAADFTIPLSGSPVKLADMNYLPTPCADAACAAEFSLGGFQDVPGSVVTIVKRPAGRRCGLGFEGGLAVGLIAWVRMRRRRRATR